MHVNDATHHESAADATDLRIGIVVSRYHEDITGAMRDDAAQAFVDAGGREADVTVVEAPGAFELTVCAAALARRPDIDAVVTLGCILTGETTHDQYIAHAVSTGLTQVSIETGKPVAFGVLTCQTIQQARDRVGGEKGNKGREAMTAAIAAVRTVRAIGEARRALPPLRRDEGRRPSPGHDPARDSAPRYADATAIGATHGARTS